MGNSHSNNNEICQLIINGKTYNLNQRQTGDKNLNRHKFSYFDLSNYQTKLMSNNPTQIRYNNIISHKTLVFYITPSHFYDSSIEKFNHKIEKDEFTDIIIDINDSKLTLKIRCIRDFYNPKSIVIEQL